MSAIRFDYTNVMAEAVGAEHGLQESDLAELAGCSARFIHTVEADKATIRLDKLCSVLNVLGLYLVVRGPAG